MRQEEARKFVPVWELLPASVLLSTSPTLELALLSSAGLRVHENRLILPTSSLTRAGMSPLQGLGPSYPHSLQVWLLHAEAGPPCHKATTLTHRGEKEPGTEAVRTMALSRCRTSWALSSWGPLLQPVKSLWEPRFCVPVHGLSWGSTQRPGICPGSTGLFLKLSPGRNTTRAPEIHMEAMHTHLPLSASGQTPTPEPPAGGVLGLSAAETHTGSLGWALGLWAGSWCLLSGTLSLALIHLPPVPKISMTLVVAVRVAGGASPSICGEC